MQTTQVQSIELVEQLFQALPSVLAFVDEAIQRHCRLPIADFRFAFSLDSCYE
jgi:hypothetical protein